MSNMFTIVPSSTFMLTFASLAFGLALTGLLAILRPVPATVNAAPTAGR